MPKSFRNWEMEPNLVVHTFNHTMQEAETDGCLSLRLAWSIQ